MSPESRACAKRCWLFNVDAGEFNEERSGLWTRGLLIRRRHIADGELAYFTTRCPAGTSIKQLVDVEGRRWLTLRRSCRDLQVCGGNGVSVPKTI